MPKLSINTTLNYSLNFDKKKRKPKEIKFIILHYTGMKKEKEALRKLTSEKSKVSSHYFIKNNGEVLTLVPDLYTAWHAGKSYWRKFQSLNKYSIGIEISNPGHDHGYKNFSSKQIHSLIKLLKYLMKKYNINKKDILGHSDVAPDRKKDPGEKFPWEILSKKNLSDWHYLSSEKIKKNRNVIIRKNEENLFFNNLYKIGYSKIDKTKNKIKKIYLVKAFQRRFRQKLINGKIDKECLLISKSLTKS